MKKNIAKILAIFISSSIVFCGCNKSNSETVETSNTTSIESETNFTTITFETTNQETTVVPSSEEIITSITNQYESVNEETSNSIPTAPQITINEETTTTIIIDNSPNETQTEASGFLGGGIIETETTAPIEEPIENTSNAVYTPSSDCLNQELTTSYPYYSLSQKDRALYDGIVAAMKQCGQVSFSTDDYSEEDWIRIFSCAYYNEPDYFWVDSILEYGVISYKITDPETIRSMQSNLDIAFTSLKQAVDQYPATVDKIKYIHDYIITTCDFSKEGPNSQTVYGGLVDHIVQCEGYSKTFLYVCNKLGIQSMIVSGLVESGLSHAWNKVYVGGDWYNIDLTQDDPILKTPNSKYVRYTNFLVPDSDILGKTHFEENLSMTYQRIPLYEQPACYGTKYNYFNYYKTIYSDYDTAMNELKKGLSLAVSEKKPLVQIKVSSDEIYDKIMSNLLELKDYLDSNAPNQFSQIASTCNEHMNIIGISITY